MTLRNRRRSLALAFGVCVTIATSALPAGAAASCQGRRATIVGTRGIDFIVGTPGPDVILGRTGIDQIYGRGGNDTICGGKGDDFIIAGDGDDRLFGQSGSDELFGDEGSDYVATGPGRANIAAGGPGDDRLVGDSGFDTANYLDAGTAVRVDLQRGTATGDGSDVLREIDGAFGTEFNDHLTGDDSDNILVGAGGADELFAGGNDGALGPTPATAGVDILVGDGDPQRVPGDDVLTGGPGVNVADYSSASASMQVDLETESATGDGLDRLVEIQVVSGSRFSDVLRGDEFDNAFRPFAGDDIVDGRDGADTVVFSSAREGVVADLGSGVATGEGTDTFENVESLWGGPRSDQLTGDAGPNSLAGTRGNDQLLGDDGDDILSGGPGTDRIDGGNGSDRCSGGETQNGCERSESPERTLGTTRAFSILNALIASSAFGP